MKAIDRVIVLGCGPAGLMAAHAVRHGYDLPLTILSVKRASPLYGAQYLHRPLPMLNLPDPVLIHYTLNGSVHDYRNKVYGPMWDGKVSPEDLNEPHYGWDIRFAYSQLVKRYWGFVQNVELKPSDLTAITTETSRNSLIINTVPLNSLCYQGHPFGFTTITAAGDAPELGIRIPFRCPTNTVVCNGDDNPSWYRLSNVYGHTTVEWPQGVHKVPVATAASVRKPTQHSCDCWPDIFCVGRYGAWKKGVLSHDAYFDTMQKLREVLDGSPAQAEA